MNEKEWFNKSIELIKLNRCKEAIKAFEKAFEMNPQNDEAWVKKSVVLGMLGGYKK